ncbi:ethanolamine ammonia-lyase subunit EutC [Kushneria phosphatilytica]|uniref:Ethanolamine ammonia-lyase small subunit n=1 Tax=Kushneria phosphatilytica TaxID=657387 RepID=A0A1S1NRH9_9GAMM|nr:ethanolamine ammonia-lyase subunit EutC [Kushneria phosphatilytica]OHV11864.1 ethanolamine ammonia-lyase [Kushneria phosphatilytica]QEL11038.1 ethanolamine ammonia-lyase subunit EutC [Kushneria phosphatilytica]
MSNENSTTASGVVSNPWQVLRQHTQARIGLGRAGSSLPTDAHLQFQLAHARARDAVHLPLDTERMVEQLSACSENVVRLHSAAADRDEYLRRPDLGRKLDEASLDALKAMNCRQCDISIVVADGLSARAIHENSVPMLQVLMPMLEEQGWQSGPLTLVEQARVAIGDPIGEALGARMSVVLIGERPGLSSPDSLGIYFTWAPRPGRRDSERNCLSNIRPNGQSFQAASELLIYLLREANERQLSGVSLKDDSVVDSSLGDGRQGNFLLPD